MRVPNTNSFSFKELDAINERVTDLIEKLLWNIKGVPNAKVKMKWVLGDFLEVSIEGDDDPIYFCPGFRSLIDFEVEFSNFSREKMRDFLQEYLTGFPNWGEFFSKKDNGKFESVEEWTLHNLKDKDKYELSKEQADDLLNNFYINNVGQLKRKILEVGVSGHNSLANYLFINKPYIRDTWTLDGLEFDVFILFRDETEATLMSSFM